MKLHTLTVMAVVVVLAACGKDGISTKPSVRFKSASTDFVPLGANLSITLEFSDKEGDITLPIHVIKVSSSCEAAGFIDSVTWVMPELPGKNVDGELEILFDGQSQLDRFRCLPPPGPGPGPDTLETAIFKFVIRDDAGNISDTAFSTPITIVK